MHFFAFRKEANYQEAVELLKGAIQIDCDFSEAVSSLAVALDNLDNSIEARENYQRAIRLRPNDPHAYNNMAVFLAKEGRTI